MFEGFTKLLEGIRDHELQIYWKKYQKSLLREKFKEGFMVTLYLTVIINLFISLLKHVMH